MYITKHGADGMQKHIINGWSLAVDTILHYGFVMKGVIQIHTKQIGIVTIGNKGTGRIAFCIVQ